MKTESKLWGAAGVVLSLVYFISVPQIWQCEGVDEIDYLSVAHSLAIGKGYTVYGTPHVLYPPLYPFLLSLIIRIAGVGSWRLMYAINAMLGISGWILIGTWMRTRFGDPGRWAAWFLLLAYYPWSFSCRFLMSEPLFLPLSFSLLILVWRVLERNIATSAEYMAIAALSLLCGMTRAAAVSLNGALVLAGLTRWATTRRRTGVVVALLALIFGVGFFTFWSVRANVVNPNAPESHWRWAKKYLGISRETTGIIARGEEVTEISSVWHRRLIFAARRYGQFVASVVRPPRGFLPAGVALSLLFVAGLIRHWRQYMWSPLAWYTAVFLTMILKTTWLSNYLRFYIMVAPFLFLFLAEGTTEWWDALRARRRVWAFVMTGLFAVWGIWSAVTGGADEEGAIAWYQSVVRWGSCGAWILVLITLWVVGSGVLRFEAARAAPWILALAAIHAMSLIGLRVSESWKNYTLRFRKLDGVMSCAKYVRETKCGTGDLLATLPQVPSFLSGCVFRKPDYDEAGHLKLNGVERVLVIGMLHEVPFFQPAEEQKLMKAVERAERDGRLVPECHCGQTILYRVADLEDVPYSLNKS